jgi:hypothetical protein
MGAITAKENRVETVMNMAEQVVTSDLTAGGILLPRQFTTFMEYAKETPTLLSKVRMIQMPETEREIDRIGLGERMMHPGAEVTPPPHRSKPAFGKITLSTVKKIGELNISYESLEDNIEKGKLRERIMRLISQRWALDWEEWLLRSTKATTGMAYDNIQIDDGMGGFIPDPQLHDADGLLQKVLNGTPSGAPWETKTGGHVIDAQGAPISKEHFFAARRAIPEKYMKSDNNWTWLTNPKLSIDFRQELTERPTSVGDSMLFGSATPAVLGYKMMDSPNVMENFVDTTPDWIWDPAIGRYVKDTTTSEKTNLSNIFFMRPDNLMCGIHRNILIETDRDIRNQNIVIVISSRIGIQVDNPDAIAMVKNVAPRPAQI